MLFLGFEDAYIERVCKENFKHIVFTTTGYFFTLVLQKRKRIKCVESATDFAAARCGGVSRSAW